MRAFFDTNVLVYAADHRDSAKQARATDLIERHGIDNSLTLSTQVLQEYFAAVTRKVGLSAEAAQRVIEIFARHRVVRIDEHAIVAAIEIHRLSRLSFWDALIIQAARVADARVL